MDSDMFSRNLKKGDLSGVIFGCQKHMMKECLTKQLFGLPGSHFSYVRNIQMGLPLFLFNYGDRSLRGIYEAASVGQMNIDPYAWTDNGMEKTKYPAQVRICVRLECHPLSENQFRDILSNNYYSPMQFCFELDHVQVDSLILLFMKSATRKSVLPAIFPRNTCLWINGLKDNISHDDKVSCELAAINSVAISLFSKIEKANELGCSNIQVNTSYESDPMQNVSEYNLSSGGTVVHKPSSISARLASEEKQSVDSEFESRTKEKDILNKLKELVNKHSSPSIGSIKNDGDQFLAKSIVQQEHEYAPQTKETDAKPEEALLRSEFKYCMTQLKDEFEMLRHLVLDQGKKITILEQKQAQAEAEILQLKKQVKELESELVITTETVDHLSMDVPDDATTLNIEEAIYLVGGFDGTSWLSRLDLYAPKSGNILPLQSMSSPRSYAGVVSLHSRIYAIGGGDGCSWYDTVECYNPSNREWSECPSMTCERGCLSAVSLKDKIFVLGGSNGIDSFCDVEMYDPVLGKWIIVGSMLNERVSHAAVELGGAIYVVGGYDGKEYLRSAERYDPRDVSWARLDCMSSRRGCPSLVVLNGKLYALGGFDGTNFLSSVEMFDPRLGSWVVVDSMNTCRGYAAAVSLGDSVHIIGGFKDEGQEITDTAECFKEGAGWQIADANALGRRCLHSAAVL